MSISFTGLDFSLEEHMNIQCFFYTLALFITVRKGVMPHITQIPAVELNSGESFTTYVLPKVPIEPKAEKVTGIIFDGNDLFVKGQKVDAVSISVALNNLLEWLAKFQNVVLVAHTGIVFDFRERA